MSTISLTAGEVMDRAAALMNDPAKTDYTYVAQLPYLNMAIDELVENLEESNSPPTNTWSGDIVVPIGSLGLYAPESSLTPHYPADLIEVQELTERRHGSTDPFIRLPRREFISEVPAAQSLLYWVWNDSTIYFNPAGALSDREVRLQYIWQGLAQVVSENDPIPAINARSYLSYKTAALCSQFIGENESRASLLEDKAEKALERLTGIHNKGRQQIMTRHRPFRAAFKARGGF